MRNHDLRVTWVTLARNAHPEKGGWRFEMWDEGDWAWLADMQADFDARRHEREFVRLEPDPTRPDDPLCGLFRRPDADTRPLYTRGYAAVTLSYDCFLKNLDCSLFARDHRRGWHDGQLDRMLREGWVHTSRGGDYAYEPIEHAQWLL